MPNVLFVAAKCHFFVPKGVFFIRFGKVPRGGCLVPGATLATSGHCAIYMRLPRVLGLNRQFHEPVFCAYGRFFLCVSAKCQG